MESSIGLCLPIELILDVMELKKCLASVLILTIVMLTTALGAFVGVNIGTDVSDLPSASKLVDILKANQITHVRLYDANAQILQALSNSGIEVIVGVINEEVLRIGESPSAAAAWVIKNVAAYVPSTNITAIAFGNEVLSTIPNAALVLVSGMNSLHKALVAANLHSRIKVSTPQSIDLIPKPFPPSIATFDSSWNSTMYQLLQFLKNTNSFYMLNAYPYYGYTKADGLFPIDFALFKPLPSVKQIVDPNTLFRYNSMLDAMVDAAYYSIEALHFNDIPVVVTETGWPWLGGGNEPDATIENAETYNNNLLLRVLNGSGPPSHPSIPVNTYIYELFNEDKRNVPISEKNWGILYPNASIVYPLSFSASNRVTGISASIFCVAKDGASTDKLENGLNWACGQGQANCAALQPGKPCYLPNNLISHASFAYNDYYQKAHGAGGTCDFNGTATTTTQDPSYGSCLYTGSSKSGEQSLPPTALGPSSHDNGTCWNLQVSILQYILSAICVFFALVVL
ncbi:hypothetical protein Lal_00049975 [Lupinus albus]|nr:hypothetical protein Lal_00049975 [Lupinus albus]